MSDNESHNTWWKTYSMKYGLERREMLKKTAIGKLVKDIANIKNDETKEWILLSTVQSFIDDALEYNKKRNR